MTRRSSPDAARRAAAFHESGHAVASVILGPGIDRAVLTPTDPHHAGFTEHRRPDALGMNPLITAAGPMAEARHRFGQRPTQREVWSVIDRHGHDYSTLVAAGNPSPTEAAPLLDRCWSAVVELAAVLYDHGEGDVIRALRIPPGEAGTRYLTELRSGYRAVS